MEKIHFFFSFATEKQEYVFRGCTSFVDGNFYKIKDNCYDQDFGHNLGEDSVSNKNYNAHYKLRLIYLISQIREQMSGPEIS